MIGLGGSIRTDRNTLVSVVRTPAGIELGIWSSAEYPQRYLDEDQWNWLFSAIPFTVDGEKATPPRSIRLYRGAALPEYRWGWSWTTDIDVARRFASGELLGRFKGLVYAADVEGWRLRFSTTNRSEAEYVVDTDGLDMWEVAA